MKNPRIKRLVLSLEVILLALVITFPSFSPPQANQAEASSTASTRYFFPFITDGSVYNWHQFGGDSTHSSNNRLEMRISVNNVAQLQLLFKAALPGIADGAPVYLSNVITPTGHHDIVFVTTRDGRILALDAHTSTLLWSKQVGPAGCLVNNNQGRNEACYTTSSPAIDPGRLFVYSYGLDGHVHKYAVGDGSETVTGGWPELTTLKGYDEKESSALSIATARNGANYLYVAHAGYPGDAGNYQGHITAINLSDGTQKVFNTLCSNQAVHFVDSRVTTGPDCSPETMGAIWSRPGVVYDHYHDRILMTTGNGTFQPGSFLWGDTVFSLNPDGSGSAGNPLDSYTPANYQHLQDTDLDLGSTEPAILPPAGGKYAHLAVQGGKDSLLRLLNLDLLSGQNGIGHTGGEVFTMPIPIGGMLLTQPAVWMNPADNSTWVFVSNGNGSAGLQLSISPAGDPSLVTRWTSGGSSSPMEVNGIVFMARSNQIVALNAINGSQLWSDNRIGAIHWESPIVDNGVVYITDQSGNLTAYSLP